MIGKKVKVNDYKFTYGEETVYLDLYGAFKNKTGYKYAIYSYSDKPNKLFYGTYFERNNEAVIMASKENPKELVKEFALSVLEGNYKDKFEIISLEKIESAEIIDEYKADFNVDGSYWSFYVNDEYCMNGIDTQVVNDQDHFKIVYAK